MKSRSKLPEAGGRAKSGSEQALLILQQLQRL